MAGVSAYMRPGAEGKSPVIPQYDSTQRPTRLAKVKVKFFFSKTLINYHTMKTCGGSSVASPLILTLSIRQNVVTKFTTPVTLISGK